MPEDDFDSHLVYYPHYIARLRSESGLNVQVSGDKQLLLLEGHPYTLFRTRVGRTRHLAIISSELYLRADRWSPSGVKDDWHGFLGSRRHSTSP